MIPSLQQIGCVLLAATLSVHADITWKMEGDDTPIAPEGAAAHPSPLDPEESADDLKFKRREPPEPLTDEQKKALEAEMAAASTPYDPVFDKIHMAIMNSDLEELKRAVDLRHPVHGPIDVNHARYVDMFGMPPLWYAIDHNKPEFVRVLLAAGADVNYEQMMGGKKQTCFDLLRNDYDSGYADADDPAGGWGTDEYVANGRTKQKIETMLKDAKAGHLPKLEGIQKPQKRRRRPRKRHTGEL